MKLVVLEAESQALTAHLHRCGDDLVTSALARVELVRAVAPAGPAAVEHAGRLLRRLHVLALDDELLDAAGRLAPGGHLRSLDAIHLAAAQLVDDLRAVVTYDARMAQAAQQLLLPTAAPA